MRKLFKQLFPTFLLLLAACQLTAPVPPPPTPETTPTHLWIGVSDGALPVAEVIEQAYAPSNVVLHFVEGNGRVLRDDLVTDQLDALLIHYLPANDPHWFNPIALDGLAIIVHADNPVVGLTRRDVQAIFNGRVNTWSDIGGTNNEIELLTREPGADALVLLQERVMEEQRINISAVTQPNDVAVIAAVAQNPDAIGYVMLGSLGDETRVRPLMLESVEPQPVTVGTQEYPLTTPLYFVSQNEPNGKLRDLIAWLQTAETQTLLGERYGRVR